MLLVADGGSAITNWILLTDEKETIAFDSAGLNPFFLNEKELVKVLNNTKQFNTCADEIKEVHFFGAGCNSPDKRELITNALSTKFKNAFVNVESDLLGSAYATCKNRPGLNCILGTGSNISYFDGEKLHDGLHGLGYIFDDEGAATFFGKKLITDFLYQKMPEDLAEKFNKLYKIDKDTVIFNLYQKKLPNFYLASHMPFLVENINNKYCYDIVYKSLDEFIITHVCTYNNYKNLNCHFVGPTANYFRDIIKELCEKHEVHLGMIIEKPIVELFNYVRKKEGF